MITVAGEALIDLIVDPAGHVDPRAGGGPFNVTRAVVRPGLPVAFLGRLAGDRFGQPMRADLERHHVTVAAGTPAESPTTLTCWTWTRPACPPTTSTWPARRRRRSGPARPCCRTAPRAGRNVLGLGTRRFDLVHRREASKPNQIWQADHTLLDLWVITPSGRPGRPWLTIVEDDHSRAVAGYAVNLGAPSAPTTALAFRQAIWRKPWPGWHVCGIPDAFHVDRGSDFTSAHLEQVMADLRTRAYFSLPGQPRGRGKVERIFGTINQMCLPALPGYAPRGTADRAGQARLTLAELDQAIGLFIRKVYNFTPHGETGIPPQQRWEAGAFIPRMPDSLEQLDLLLLTVAKPRKIHPDGIHFQGLRYLDPVLAAYVGDTVVIRYDPRDMAEIRVFTGAGFLCRAICPELAGTTVTLKDITAARNARRRGLARGLRDRASVVDRLLGAHQEQPPPGATGTPVTASGASSRLKLYRAE